MDTQATTRTVIDITEIGLRLKLAALWTSFMFLYIYVDYLHFYMPGTLKDIQNGRVFVFDITQGFLLGVLISFTIPVLMIFLSVVLPATINRWANMITAALSIPYMLFNLAGEAWMHMVFAAGVEVVLLCLIIRYARKWPRTDQISNGGK